MDFGGELLDPISEECLLTTDQLCREPKVVCHMIDLHNVRGKPW